MRCGWPRYSQSARRPSRSGPRSPGMDRDSRLRRRRRPAGQRGPDALDRAAVPGLDLAAQHRHLADRTAKRTRRGPHGHRRPGTTEPAAGSPPSAGVSPVHPRGGAGSGEAGPGSPGGQLAHPGSAPQALRPTAGWETAARHDTRPPTRTRLPASSCYHTGRPAEAHCDDCTGGLVRSPAAPDPASRQGTEPGDRCPRVCGEDTRRPARRVGDQDAHPLERQSRCVTIAGRGHRAISA